MKLNLCRTLQLPQKYFFNHINHFEGRIHAHTNMLNGRRCVRIGVDVLPELIERYLVPGGGG